MRPSTGWAQYKKTGTFAVAAEVGGRGFTSEPSARDKGMFELYKDVPAGAVVQQLLLSYTPADSFGVYQITGRNLLQRNQSIALRASQPGNYDFQVRWDRVAHTHSTDARSLGSFGNGGVYTLPPTRSVADSNLWRAAGYLAPIRTQWDPIRMSLGLTPKEAWDFKAQYTRIGKLGNRPMGMAFGSPGGNAREILEPIDQNSQDFRLAQSYARERFQLAASYDYLFFKDAFASVTSDNPQVATDRTNGTSRGRSALAPDNSAQTATAMAAVNLPFHTRVVANGSYSWQRQNVPFLPQTINSTLATDTRLELPRNSLDGRVTTSLVSASLNSRPWKELVISARARSYQYQPQTESFAITNMAINDQSIGTTPEESAYSPFSKDNADVSVSYRLAPSLSVSGGFGWERWTRDPEVRMLKTTKENTPRASVDFTGIEWLSLRGTYSKGQRRGTEYMSGPDDNPGFREVDQADRDRERTTILASLTPIDQLSVSLTWQVGHDAYPNSPYGLQSDQSAMAGGEIEWSPSSRFTIGAGYTKEDFDNLLIQRYRTPANPPATLDNTTWDWIGRHTDHVTTTYADFSAVLIPNKLEAGGNFSLSDARFRETASNPTTPTGGTAAQNLAATAVDWPEVSQKLQPMTLFLRYRYTSDWAVTFRYQAETYTQNDFRTLAPSFMSTGGDLPTSIGNYIFLGNNYRNYNASWFTLLISYRPLAMPFSRGRSAM